MTDDPVSGVQLTVVVPKLALRLFTNPPASISYHRCPSGPDRCRNATERVTASVGADVWTVDDWVGAQPKKR